MAPIESTTTPVGHLARRGHPLLPEPVLRLTGEALWIVIAQMSTFRGWLRPFLRAATPGQCAHTVDPLPTDPTFIRSQGARDDHGNNQ